MTASIAHEINQPLAAIVANGNAGLRWLERATPDVDEARAAFTRIVNDGRRAGEVIESIRAMFKNVDQEKTPVDINKLVRDMLGLMLGELRSNQVSVETRLADNLPDVRGNQVQLQQVILNLIRNAIEAMNSVTDRARVLRIGTEIHEPDGVLVSVRELWNGPQSKRYRAHLQLLFHDQAARHRDGVVHLSVHHRRSSGPALGFIRHRPRGDF